MSIYPIHVIFLLFLSTFDHLTEEYIDQMTSIFQRTCILSWFVPKARIKIFCKLLRPWHFSTEPSFPKKSWVLNQIFGTLYCALDPQMVQIYSKYLETFRDTASY